MRLVLQRCGKMGRLLLAVAVLGTCSAAVAARVDPTVERAPLQSAQPREPSSVTDGTEVDALDDIAARASLAGRSRGDFPSTIALATRPPGRRAPPLDLPLYLAHCSLLL